MLDKKQTLDWIAALRSGDYTQGFKRLKICNSDKAYSQHCCLGVFAEISDDYEWSTAETMFVFKSNEELKLFSGILDETSIQVNVQNFLTKLNDIGYTFEQIADILEKIFINRKKNVIMNSDYDKVELCRYCDRIEVFEDVD